jgi:Protein of unknown function with HXXEE motif
MWFQKLQWLFPIAVTFHNSEEAFWLPPWWVQHAKEVTVHPGAGAFRYAAAVLTVAAFVVTFLSERKGKESVWAYLLFGYIVAMLANVFIPHIPASFEFRSYTPGVVMAVLINLPVMSFLSIRAIRERLGVGEEGGGVRCGSAPRNRCHDSDAVPYPLRWRPCSAHKHQEYCQEQWG